MKLTQRALLTISCIALFIPALSAQEEPHRPDLDITVSIKNQHYWRGSPIGYSPLISSQASLKAGGFEVGTWNGFGFDGVFKDVDTYISYTAAGLTIAVWDVYNFTDPKSGKADPATFPTDYFDYGSATTRHFIDLSVAYAFQEIPLKLYWATIVHGRDRGLDTTKDYKGLNGEKIYNGTRSGDNRYSSYFQASYTIKTKKADLTLYASTGFALKDVDGTSFYGPKSFGITEIGATVDKNVKITDNYSVGVTAGIVGSPVNKTMNGILALKLF
jgi:hypothetical protein